MIEKDKELIEEIMVLPEIFNRMQIIDMPVYIVYEYYNYDGNLLYVGKSRDFYNRHYDHITKDKWKNEIYAVCIREYKNQADMTLAEAYYIMLKKPKYNKQLNYGIKPTFELSDDAEEYWCTESELCWYWYSENPFRKMIEQAFCHSRDLYKRNMQ